MSGGGYRLKFVLFCIFHFNTCNFFKILHQLKKQTNCTIRWNDSKVTCKTKQKNDNWHNLTFPKDNSSICSPVSGSHWCSHGSRRRRPHSSLTQGPLAFCWWYNKIWAGFSQSEASSWLPCSRMNLDPDDGKVQRKHEATSVAGLALLVVGFPHTLSCTARPYFSFTGYNVLSCQWGESHLANELLNCGDSGSVAVGGPAALCLQRPQTDFNSHTINKVHVLVTLAAVVA